jgi:hypothetical protein
VHFQHTRSSKLSRLPLPLPTGSSRYPAVDSGMTSAVEVLFCGRLSITSLTITTTVGTCKSPAFPTSRSIRRCLSTSLYTRTSTEDQAIFFILTLCFSHELITIFLHDLHDLHCSHSYSSFDNHADANTFSWTNLTTCGSNSDKLAHVSKPKSSGFYVALKIVGCRFL